LKGRSTEQLVQGVEVVEGIYQPQLQNLGRDMDILAKFSRYFKAFGRAVTLFFSDKERIKLSTGTMYLSLLISCS